MADNDITKMKVADLKKELKIRGLSTAGNKTELTERLQAVILDGDTTLEHLDDSADLNGDEILDDDVLNDDELDEEETKSLLDSNHEDAVLKTPPESVKSKSPETPTDALNQRKLVLKRKLTISVPGDTDCGGLTSDVETPSADSNGPKLLKTSISGPSDDVESSTVLGISKIDSLDKESESNDNKIVKLSQLTAKERLELRVKKFGGPIAAESLKLSRAERFGLTKDSENGSKYKIESSSPATVDLLKKRAERFGGSVSKVMNKIENLEKLQKRQARFGKGATSTTEKVAESETTEASVVKISDKKEITADDFAEKAKLRLERFKQTVK